MKKRKFRVWPYMSWLRNGWCVQTKVWWFPFWVEQGFFYRLEDAQEAMKAMKVSDGQ
jgi:hypothetical protein